VRRVCEGSRARGRGLVAPPDVPLPAACRAGARPRLADGASSACQQGQLCATRAQPGRGGGGQSCGATTPGALRPLVATMAVVASSSGYSYGHDRPAPLEEVIDGARRLRVFLASMARSRWWPPAVRKKAETGTRHVRPNGPSSFNIEQSGELQLLTSDATTSTAQLMARSALGYAPTPRPLFWTPLHDS